MSLNEKFTNPKAEASALNNKYNKLNEELTKAKKAVDDFETQELGMSDFYKSIKNNPAYSGRNISFINFEGNSIFGYDSAAKEGDEIIAIGGKIGNMPYLTVGDKIRLKTTIFGLNTQDDAEIIGFQEPFKNNETDHIVKIKQGNKINFLKTTEIEKID